MWNGDNSTIGQNISRNYMYGEKVFILDSITANNCAYLIGDITAYILDERNNGKRLIFIINSPGGEVDTMFTLVGLMNMARLYNIEIYTFVLGIAGSAASMLAIQGDERYISTLSRHFVHFGCIYDMTTKHSEIEKMYVQNKEYADNMINLYLDACGNKLSRTELLRLQSDERGYLSAEQCLKYGLCDFIIEGELANKIRYENLKREYDKGFLAFEKSKIKKPAENTINKKGKDSK